MEDTVTARNDAIQAAVEAMGKALDDAAGCAVVQLARPEAQRIYAALKDAAHPAPSGPEARDATPPFDNDDAREKAIRERWLVIGPDANFLLHRLDAVRAALAAPAPSAWPEGFPVPWTRDKDSATVRDATGTVLCQIFGEVGDRTGELRDFILAAVNRVNAARAPVAVEWPDIEWDVIEASPEYRRAYEAAVRDCKERYAAAMRGEGV